MNKKLFKLIKIFLTSIFIIFIIYAWVNIISSKKNNQPPQIFGYSLFIVETPSMEEYLHVNDMVLVKINDIEDVKVGDVISFMQIDKTSQIYGRYVTHRVIEKEELDGKIYLTTKGDNNNDKDSQKVTTDNYYGKIVGKSTFLGNVMNFITNGYNFIFIAIFIALTTFIIYQIKVIVKTLKENKISKVQLSKVQLSKVQLTKDEPSKTQND